MCECSKIEPVSPPGDFRRPSRFNHSCSIVGVSPGGVSGRQTEVSLDSVIRVRSPGSLREG